MYANDFFDCSRSRKKIEADQSLMEIFGHNLFKKHNDIFVESDH